MIWYSDSYAYCKWGKLPLSFFVNIPEECKKKITNMIYEMYLRNVQTVNQTMKGIEWKQSDLKI